MLLIDRIKYFNLFIPFNPRLTKGLLQPPYGFPGRSKTLRKVTKGI